jgi:SAM-dependent methyltransferase
VDRFRRDPNAYEDALVPVLFGPIAERLLDLVAPRPGERALDLACGTGAVTRRLVERTAPGGQVTGLDPSGPMLGVARGAAPAATFVEGEAGRLPFRDGAFDVATCQQGLQFVPDRVGALRELRRVLHPDGRAGIALWADIETHPGFARLREALERRLGPDAARVMDLPYGLPDAAMVAGLARDGGFAEVRVEVDEAVIEWDSVEQFVRRYGQGSMLADVFAAAPPEALQAIVEDVAAAFELEPSDPLRFGQRCHLYRLSGTELDR